MIACKSCAGKTGGKLYFVLLVQAAHFLICPSDRSPPDVIHCCRDIESLSVLLLFARFTRMKEQKGISNENEWASMKQNRKQLYTNRMEGSPRSNQKTLLFNLTTKLSCDIITLLVFCLILSFGY